MKMARVCNALAIAIGVAINASATEPSDTLALGRAAHEQSEITLVSVADPMCEGGLGFERADRGIATRTPTFVVPTDAVFVATEIRWAARAPEFDSSAERISFRIASNFGSSAAETSSQQAVVESTRVGNGKASGQRTYKSGVSFASGAALCGHVTRGAAFFSEPHVAKAKAIVRGHFVDSASSI